MMIKQIDIDCITCYTVYEREYTSLKSAYILIVFFQLNEFWLSSGIFVAVTFYNVSAFELHFARRPHASTKPSSSTGTTTKLISTKTNHIPTVHSFEARAYYWSTFASTISKLSSWDAYAIFEIDFMVK